MHVVLRLTLFLTLLVHYGRAFYIPGWSMKTYADGERIPLYINKVYSDHTQLQYAFDELPFVCPPAQHKEVALGLGELLRGDRVTESDYELKMGADDELHSLCDWEMDAKAIDRARDVVRDGYVAEWIVDNLPGATSFASTDKSKRYYAAGFKMGRSELPPNAKPDTEPELYLNNHFTIVIRYNKAPGKDGEEGRKVIVGFEVYPKSIDGGAHGGHKVTPEEINSVTTKGLKLPPAPSNKGDEPELVITVPYSYSVYFRQETKLSWSNRWDMYFAAEEDSSKIHFLGIINSLVILGLLTAAVAAIIARTVRGANQSDLEDANSNIRLRNRDGTGKGHGLLSQPNDIESATDLGDEENLDDTTGWKLVHGDVFRAPHYSDYLAPIVGSGIQLIFVASGLLLLSCFGVLNPSLRGGFASAGIGLFVFAGLFAGYYSSRLYKTLDGKDWRRNVLMTGLALPGLFFSTVFILNLFVWAQESSTALPFSTLLALMFLLLLIQLPLVYLGGWYGYTVVGSWEQPIKPNAIPRQIPRAHWYSHNLRNIFIAALIPFAVIFIELLFVFKSLWQDKTGYYYVFGFLSIVSLILLITIMEISVIATYVQLNSENYHWWWQSFLVGASSSIWIFIYSIWFYFTKLHVSGFINGVLFFSYSLLACTMYGVLAGTVGFIASYTFVRKIYSAIKTD